MTGVVYLLALYGPWLLVVDEKFLKNCFMRPWKDEGRRERVERVWVWVCVESAAVVSR